MLCFVKNPYANVHTLCYVSWNNLHVYDVWSSEYSMLSVINCKYNMLSCINN